MKGQFMKTKLCPYQLRGNCNNGSMCTYAHGKHELRPLPDLLKTKLCESVTKSYDCKNPHCSYAHTREDLRATADLVAYKTSLCFFHKKGKCLNGDKCRFAHGSDELKPAHLESSASSNSAYYPAGTRRPRGRNLQSVSQPNSPRRGPMAMPRNRSSVSLRNAEMQPPHFPSDARSAASPEQGRSRTQVQPSWAMSQIVLPVAASSVDSFMIPGNADDDTTPRDAWSAQATGPQRAYEPHLNAGGPGRAWMRFNGSSTASVPAVGTYEKNAERAEGASFPARGGVLQLLGDNALDKSLNMVDDDGSTHDGGEARTVTDNSSSSPSSESGRSCAQNAERRGAPVRDAGGGKSADRSGRYELHLDKRRPAVESVSVDAATLLAAPEEVLIDCSPAQLDMSTTTATREMQWRPVPSLGKSLRGAPPKAAVGYSTGGRNESCRFEEESLLDIEHADAGEVGSYRQPHRGEEPVAQCETISDPSSSNLHQMGNRGSSVPTWGGGEENWSFESHPDEASKQKPLHRRNTLSSTTDTSSWPVSAPTSQLQDPRAAQVPYVWMPAVVTPQGNAEFTEDAWVFNPRSNSAAPIEQGCLATLSNEHCVGPWEKGLSAEVAEEEFFRRSEDRSARFTPSASTLPPKSTPPPGRLLNQTDGRTVHVVSSAVPPRQWYSQEATDQGAANMSRCSSGCPCNTPSAAKTKHHAARYRPAEDGRAIVADRLGEPCKRQVSLPNIYDDHQYRRSSFSRDLLVDSPRCNNRDPDEDDGVPQWSPNTPAFGKTARKTTADALLFDRSQNSYDGERFSIEKGCTEVSASLPVHNGCSDGAVSLSDREGPSPKGPHRVVQCESGCFAQRLFRRSQDGADGRPTMKACDSLTSSDEDQLKLSATTRFGGAANGRRRMNDVGCPWNGGSCNDQDDTDCSSGGGSEASFTGGVMMRSETIAFAVPDKYHAPTVTAFQQTTETCRRRTLYKMPREPQSFQGLFTVPVMALLAAQPDRYED